MKRFLVALMAALGLLVGQQLVNPSPALADDYMQVYHRTYSAIPNIRVWSDDKVLWYDVPRGGYAGYLVNPFLLDNGWVYIPVGYCLEDNIYLNNTYLYQTKTSGGKYYGLGSNRRFHSLTIFAPGADGVCD